MNYSKIIGTGGYLPPKVLTNEDLEKMVATSHQWIVERTGICKRHIISPGETASTMAKQASLRAIESAGIDPHIIDMIVVGTTTPDRTMPGVACQLQADLGLTGMPAFDIQSACAGFIFSMSIADQYIRSGAAKNILVVGTEAMSTVLDWTDRRTCVLFGDGAGAIVLQASNKPGVLSTHLHTDGRYGDSLYVPSGLPGLAKPDEPPYVMMSGNEVFKFAVNKLHEVVLETLDANQMTHDDIDWFIPHQANIRIIEATVRKLGISMDRVVLTVAEQGNTSAASIPLALDLAVRDGRIQRGHRLLMETFGGGLAWGAALVEY
jgi:3-oxoacyl-[acyl-carrier-protein] synthase III